MREKPYLTIDANNKYQVFVPDLQTNAKGASWTDGPTKGESISIDDFYIAKPETSDAASINAALSEGKNLLFTPGIYHLNETIRVIRPDTVVLGIGFATLMPHNGVTALSVADVDGVIVAGLLFDAGKESSPSLLEIGHKGSSADHSANPTSLHDLFFRVGGGAAIGKAEVSLQINSNNVIGDHFWIWRADHGTDVGWDLNTTKNGLVVDGDHVTIYGLFVEHYHEYQTLWNGNHGRMYFYQSEIPYDVPDQESWMSNHATVNGFASYKVAESVSSHDAWGLGIYSFFRDAEVKLNSAIEIPDTAGVKIHNATSVFLAGKTGSEITHVVNEFGEAVTYAGNRKTITEYTPRTAKSITPVDITTIAGKAPLLPMSVKQDFTDSSAKLVPVKWDSLNPSQYASEGSFTVEGTVNASSNKAVARVTVAAAPDVAVTDIHVIGAGNASAITVKGGKLQMSAVVTPANADNTTVSWSVYNMNGAATDKATINSEGLLTAAKNGTVKVVAVAGDSTGVKGEAVITISNQVVKVSGIQVAGAGSATTIAKKAGTLQMSASVMPSNADNAAITWSVENITGKAAIDASGLLRAQSDGVVNVIAAAQDGSGVKGEATIRIIGQTVILESGWSWVRESQGNWAIESNDANVMKLMTEEGSWRGSKPKNIVLRSPGSNTSDFSIATKLEFDASRNFEWAGLIVYQDDGNAITLGRSAVGQIRFSQIKGGAQTDKNYADPDISKDIYLKIEKAGTSYKGYYSSDGLTWTTTSDTFNNFTAITTPKVGIFVRKLNTAISSKTATFSNFKINDEIVPYWNPISSIDVTGKDGTTEIASDGGTLQMSAAALPANADNKAVMWSVANMDNTPTEKATISSDGLLTAMKNGRVKVVATATDGSGVTGSAAIDISGQLVAVTSIHVTGENGSTAITTKDGTMQMSAKVLPKDADFQDVTWSVVNTDDTATDLATISEDGVLTAVKDGTVKVVATANDGSGVEGALSISISGQMDEECISECGNPTPTPTPTPTTKPTHQQIITDADLKTVKDGKAIVILKEGRTEAVLPIELTQNINHSLEVQSGAVSIIIPPAVIREAGANVSIANIVVRIEENQSGIPSMGGSNLKLNKPIYNLDFMLVDKDGKETKLKTFSEPVYVSMPYDVSLMDEQLLGIYVYDEQLNEWTYIGGVIDSHTNKLTASAPHFSKYAVMEYNKTFKDVPSDHWAHRTLQVLAAKHIISGQTETEFNPSGKTTRAQFVTMLVKTLGLKAPNANTPFTDVRATDWYASDIAAAYEAGLILGVSDHDFAPKAQITREQMAALIVRAYEYAKGEKSSPTDHVSLLKDQKEVSSWATKEVNKAIELGLMKGTAVHVFAPQIHAKRAETAQAILNLFNLIQTVN